MGCRIMKGVSEQCMARLHLTNPPVLKAPTPDGLFRLESDTLREVWVALYYKNKEMNGQSLDIILKDSQNQQRILALQSSN